MEEKKASADCSITDTCLDKGAEHVCARSQLMLMDEGEKEDFLRDCPTQPGTQDSTYLYVPHAFISAE